MIDALTDVQPLFAAYADAFFSQPENVHARFIAAGLLSGNYMVECYSEFRRRGGEQILIYIRHHCKSIAFLQFAQRFDGIGKWLPGSHRFRERTNFRVRRGESQALAEASHHRLQDVAITQIFSLFACGFEFGIPGKKRRIREHLAMRAQDWAQGGEDAALPIDHRAITVEGQNLEARQVEHDDRERPSMSRKQK